MQDFSDLGITRAEYYSSEWHKIMRNAVSRQMDEIVPPRRRASRQEMDQNTVAIGEEVYGK
jgi:hypothetical protein